MMLRGRFLPLLAVILAGLFTLLQSGPLNGTGAALLLSIMAQRVLPGWLLARALGRHRSAHPVARLAWVLLAGIALTVTLGAFARLLGVPVPFYLLILFIIMGVLALLPARPAPADDHPWRWTWRALPLYLLLALCCAVVFGVSYESRYRFYSLIDQPIFIGHIDWMATRADEQPPGGLPIRSRQIGIAAGGTGDERFDTDGWTYTQAAWVWASGVPAWQLIWYDLGTLFIWLVPLLTFALAYELTGRESAAAFSAAGLTLAGLLTLDNLVYNPGYESLGRFTVFQINTLRQASLTLVLPLVLLAGMAYLRTFQRRDLVLILLGGFALATMHPFQIVIFLLAMGGVMGMVVLWQVIRRDGIYPIATTARDLGARFLPLLAVFALLLVLPAAQRFARVGLGEADSLVSSEAATGATGLPYGFTAAAGTYIRDPAAVFYHAVIALGAGLALLWVVRVRRSLTAQYLVSATLIVLIISFTPGLTALVNRLLSSLGLFTLTYMLPVPLALGLSLDALLGWLESRGLRRAWGYGGAVVLSAAAFALLIYEPLPIPTSARDQIRAFNAAQESERLPAAHLELAAALRELLPTTGHTVVSVPPGVTNAVIETVPGAFVTGGRRGRDQATNADARFYTLLGAAPWLDDADLRFLAEYDVRYIALNADDTRLPQIAMQPERFAFERAVGGYSIYRVLPGITADETDAQFAAMNALYAEIERPRWDRAGFTPPLPGDARWADFAAAWAEQLTAQPDDDHARLGLAFSSLMAGDDAGALNEWAALRERYPQVAFYRVAETYARYAVQPDAGSIAPLLDGLAAPDVGTALVSARALLNETFFYLLTSEQIDSLLTLIDAQPTAWAQLAEIGQFDAVRRRAGLLLYAGRYAAAAAMLARLPEVRLSPDDLSVLAQIAWAQGSPTRALDVLRPATDADWVAPRAQAHPDRWANNTAAQLYDALTSGTARLPEGGNLYITSPQIERPDEQTLNVTAAFGGAQPTNAYPPQTWLAQLINPQDGTIYAEDSLPAKNVAGMLTQGAFTLAVPDDLPPLTPALVALQVRYDNRVASQPVLLPVLLKRPDATTLPPGALPVNRRFGDHITLAAVQQGDDPLSFTLFWQADAPLTQDVQVFVHVFDAAGNRVAQRDSAPLDNRYPTSQWRAGVLIADTHTVVPETPLPPGEYTVRLGLYTLPDGARLPITPADDRSTDDSLIVLSVRVG
jgi:hypothetical protein